MLTATGLKLDPLSVTTDPTTPLAGLTLVITGRPAVIVSVLLAGCRTGAVAVTPKAGVFSPEPMLFVHGDADDYAYMSDCQSYARRIAEAGTPTEFVVLAGARHKFDVDNGRRISLPSSTKNREGCPLEFDIVELKMHDRRNGEALAAERLQAINRELCADKGATMEGDRKAREAAAVRAAQLNPNRTADYLLAHQESSPTMQIQGIGPSFRPATATAPAAGARP